MTELQFFRFLTVALLGYLALRWLIQLLNRSFAQNHPDEVKAKLVQKQLNGQDVYLREIRKLANEVKMTQDPDHKWRKSDIFSPINPWGDVVGIIHITSRSFPGRTKHEVEELGFLNDLPSHDLVNIAFLPYNSSHSIVTLNLRPDTSSKKEEGINRCSARLFLEFLAKHCRERYGDHCSVLVENSYHEIILCMSAAAWDAFLADRDMDELGPDQATSVVAA